MLAGFWEHVLQFIYQQDIDSRPPCYFIKTFCPNYDLTGHSGTIGSWIKLKTGETKYVQDMTPEQLKEVPSIFQMSAKLYWIESIHRTMKTFVSTTFGSRVARGFGSQVNWVLNLLNRRQSPTGSSHDA
jgi:hypothetical protein